MLPYLIELVCHAGLNVFGKPLGARMRMDCVPLDADAHACRDDVE